MLTNPRTIMFSHLTIYREIHFHRMAYFLGDVHHRNLRCTQSIECGTIHAIGPTSSTLMHTLINDTTPSTNSNEGALVVEGGVGIGGALNVGGEFMVGGSFSILSTEVSDSCNTGALTIAGGVGICEDVNIGGKIRIESTEPSISTDSGALVVGGGIGVGGGLMVNENSTLHGSVYIADTTGTTVSGIGALVVEGGVSVGNNLYVSGTIFGSIGLKVETISSSVTLSDQNIVNVDSGTDVTLTLPSVSVFTGRTYTIIKESPVLVTIDTLPLEKIFDGTETDTYVLSGIIGQRIILTSNGVRWYIM